MDERAEFDGGMTRQTTREGGGADLHFVDCFGSRRMHDWMAKFSSDKV
jgi:hypothetical protein